MSAAAGHGAPLPAHSSAGPAHAVLPSAAELRALVDRDAIRAVLVRYYHGADTGDREVVRSCFTDDVQAHYDGREPVAGLDALMAQIPLFDNLASGRCTICTHFMGNLRFVSLDAAAAETETHVFAFLVVPDGDATADGGRVVNMRSLRYLDRWRRAPGASGMEWKIAARRHTLDWYAAVPAAFARTFAERLRGLPDAAVAKSAR